MVNKLIYARNSAILLLIFLLPCGLKAQQIAEAKKGLKDYYRSFFPIGVAITPRQLQDSAQRRLILTHFNSVTAENAMKMGVIHPEEKRYDWSGADAIVDFAVANGLKVRGHNLCWHTQAPKWIFYDESGQLVTKEVLLGRLKAHIFAVVGRYKGKIYAWDVVNEAVSDDPKELYRNSLWYKICGEDYIAKAFEYAHEADPKAVLFYNDYNTEYPEKRARILRLLKKLVDAHVPINAIGLQGHWSIKDPSEEMLKTAIDQYVSLGLKVQITELDISVYTDGNIPEKAGGGGLTGFTPEVEQQQVNQYGKFFKVFREYKNHLTGVTFWNLSDRYTWLDNFPVRGRKNYPLLFDAELEPKKAYWNVINLNTSETQAQTAHNPVIFADVPDLSMIRVGDTYYMSSTTMHMSPGLPIMKSKDMVNWEIASYAYTTLGDSDALTLKNGKNAYGMGSWASSLRYHKGVFYVSTFSSTTGKTYIYSTKDIEKGAWKCISFAPSLHDHSLFFDDDGKAYLIYGAGKIMIAELNSDLSGIKPNTQKVLIENASLAAGSNVGLPAEGSQLFKINGKYYLFNICWPRGGMRTVLIHRADQLMGPYEGKIGLQDKGVAQGGLIQTPKGAWYAYLFRDFGAVGRIPYLVPVSWKDGWPEIGIDRKVPEELPLPPNKALTPGIVNSDEFNRRSGQAGLPLVWQWNHNPDNQLWSFTRRKGYLRLSTGQLATNLLDAQNTLTQRTFGPQCSATTMIDVSGMKDGDASGLALLQKKYGWIGVKMRSGAKFITVEIADPSLEPVQIELSQNMVYLRADCNFENRKDQGTFYYSLDGVDWKALGSALHMEYTIPHFMGYRFGLFNYATQSAGGYTDFNFFHIN